MTSTHPAVTMTGVPMRQGSASARSPSPSSRTTWSTWPTRPSGHRSPRPGWPRSPPHSQGSSTSTAAPAARPWPNTSAGERRTGRAGNPPCPCGSPLSWPPGSAPACSWPRPPGPGWFGSPGWRLAQHWPGGCAFAPRPTPWPGGAAPTANSAPPGCWLLWSGRATRTSTTWPFPGRLSIPTTSAAAQAGRLWHGRRPLDRTLDTLWWEATRAAETLGFGPDLHIYPVLCVHVARLPWLRELLVDGIPVLAAGALRPALQTTRQALSPEQVELVAAHIHAAARRLTHRRPGTARSAQHWTVHPAPTGLWHDDRQRRGALLFSDEFRVERRADREASSV